MEGKMMELEQAKDIALEFMVKIADECKKGDIVGSVRRNVPEVHDIDLVVIPKAKPFLFTMPAKMRGEKIIRIAYKGIDIDIYIADEKTYEVLKLIRTGSAEHNIKLCSEAKKRGWQLKANGEGLIDLKTGETIDNTEEGILTRLLGKYIEPERRIA